jgi:hypothetical protein
MFTSGAPVSDNTGSKCKIICRIKIPPKAGLPFVKGGQEGFSFQCLHNYGLINK